MTNGVSHKWEPIEDLPTNWQELESVELRSLGDVWFEQKEQLEGSGSLTHFNDRLRREWAIETGVIERVYSLDRGVTEVLIERGIDAAHIPRGATDKDPELVAAIIRDHESAIDWVFEVVRGDRPVSTGFIRELHALMTRHQATASGRDQFGRLTEVDLLHGEWKRLPNNPTRPDGSVHEYCPPEQVASEMDRLLGRHAQHLSAGVPPEVEAAWLHHRFTEVHPFQDGNGRVARAITSLVFIRAGWFPPVVTRDNRTAYLDVLERADEGDLGPLVGLLVRLERKAFTQALGIAREASQEGERLDQRIASLGDIFKKRDEALQLDWDRAKVVADHALARAGRRLDAVKEQLASATQRLFYVDVQPNGREQSHWHRVETEEVARRLDYFANHRDYRAWARLKLVADTESFVLLSLTAVGREFRGVIGASVSFFRREESAEGQRHVVDITPASDELFQINYKEDEASVLMRFDDWFERGLTCALEMWRQGI